MRPRTPSRSYPKVVFDRNATAGDLAGLTAAYRNAGGGLMSRIAAAGIRQ